MYRGVIVFKRIKRMEYKKMRVFSKILSFGAEGRTRTGTVSLPVDFESTTSANSITSAHANYNNI